MDASVIEAKPSHVVQIKIKTAYLHKFLKRNGMCRQALTVSVKVSMDLRPTSMLTKTD